LDSLLGIPIGVTSLDDAATDAIRVIESRSRQIVFACANSNAMNVARSDPAFREALLDTDQLVADGVGVSIVARLARKNVGPRIIGHQYYEAIMKKLQQRGHGRVFFFGSSQAVLNLIHQRFITEYPELIFCGAISPPFGEWPGQQNSEFIQMINAATPDVLWVGMTAPKQEKWVFANRRLLDAPVIGSVGAVFDFYAGTVKPSPGWVRRVGLEALYRLAAEPKRLWRRVLVSNVSFLRVGIWSEVLGFGRNRYTNEQ
jgi:N-acetylglucosaminyldiphosphoundecaprenol N-acetyl-beta-D-mannosaminyltransferase